MLLFFQISLNAGLVGTRKVKIGQEIQLNVPATYTTGITWGWRWYTLYSTDYIILRRNSIYQCYVTLTEKCKNEGSVTVYFEQAYSDGYGHELWDVLWWELEIEQEEIKVTQITLNPKSASMKVGDELRLSAIVLPSDATNKSVTWSSNSTGIATIDNNGKVTALSSGTATITCKANDGSGIEATCSITVKPPVKPEKLSLSKEASVAAGQTITLVPEITPADAETTLTWASDDETIATVNTNGVVTGVKKGMTFITVTTDNGLEAFCELTVTEAVAPEPTKITIPDKLSVSVGQKMKIEYTLMPENAETTVTWTVSKEIATIDADGFITGMAEGLAVVKATTANGVESNACRLTVTPAPKTNADVNGDGTVDVADISAVISVMAGQGDEAAEKSADVNGDGTVDVADISFVIARMAELARMPRTINEEE